MNKSRKAMARRGPVVCVLALSSCAPGGGSIKGREAAVAGVRLPPRCVAEAGAPFDAVTGLPRRIRHEPSGMVLVLVPAGEFVMGVRGNESPSRRQHRRVITRAFYLGETEVTNAQFRRFVEATGYRTDAERGAPDNRTAVGGFAQTERGDRD